MTISAEVVAAGSVSIMDLCVEGEDTYWTQLRPANGGRCTLVKRSGQGELHDLTPPEFNVRTRVHEYGGGAFAVKGGVIYASNAEDGAIYRIVPGEAPVRLTQGKRRFADLQVTPYGLVAVAEEASNFLVLIDVSTGECQTLAAGYDFYASPAVSGSKIAWLCWNHPNMPWVATELWSAELSAAGVTHARRVGGAREEAILQPGWSPDQTLYCITDREGGWWNLHRVQGDQMENVCPMQAEVGAPLWVFGQSTYAFVGDQVVFTYNCEGCWHLAQLDVHTRQWHRIAQQGTVVQQLRSTGAQVRFLERYPMRNEAIMQVEGEELTCLYQADLNVDAEWLSAPRHITFPSGERQAHAFLYLPKNTRDKPPLIVVVHGGPTAQALGSLQMKLQFWTSHGFAVLDVNYAGSTGYGRAYRQLLDHNWGVVDVQDCVNGAAYLVSQGLVDGNKLAIRGGSAGGYTTLAALSSSQVFKAGASYYGVADLTVLAKDTHKFESRYLDGLIGKYPEERALCEQRSPIHAVDKITAPLILFQGEDDPVVPKNQAVLIYEALKKRGVKVELHLFPGEKHGFVQAKHIIASLNAELQFYQEVFSSTAMHSKSQITS